MNIIDNDRDVKAENRKEVDKLLLECADRLQELLDQVPVTGKCKLATDDGQPTKYGVIIIALFRVSDFRLSLVNR